MAPTAAQLFYIILFPSILPAILMTMVLVGYGYARRIGLNARVGYNLIKNFNRVTQFLRALHSLFSASNSAFCHYFFQYRSNKRRAEWGKQRLGQFRTADHRELALPTQPVNHPGQTASRVSRGRPRHPTNGGVWLVASLAHLHGLRH